jgi:Ca-activated chloride channel family protein
VIYRSAADRPYSVWLPSDGKRVLYDDEMEYLLQQLEEYKARGDGRRYERQICDQREEIDLATGIEGLYGFQKDRPADSDIIPFLVPPSDRAAWSRAAAADTTIVAKRLANPRVEVVFPERVGPRMETHLTVILPADTELGVVTNERERQEIRLNIEGLLEHNGRIFDRFRMRFLLTPPDEPAAIALVAPRRLRPGQSFLARLRITDEITGRTVPISLGFVVPSQPTPIETVAPPISEAMIIALGDELKQQRVAGLDSLILIPPETDVIFGLWRAEALVTGTGITKVAFFLADKQIFKRTRPPFSAELRLPAQPVEQVVRAEGYSATNELLASDEVVLNQPRGALQVRIMDPPRGARLVGKALARVEVVVPEERKVEKVGFSVDEQETALLDKPPWQTEILIPPTYAGSQDIHYLTVTAYLDDGSVAEDVRFLNPPEGIEEVDVNLVELYTTVSDKNGRLVRGLGVDRFQVREDDRPQKIAKFELVENLPLTLGFTIDTSGSMYESIEQAKRAAEGFLHSIITPRDIAFAVAFSDRPELIMPRTSDVGAIVERLQNLLPSGSTALHDAVVTSLYYFRGIRGRRALVLLSDGEDTSSTITFPETLEYARRSGVSIYTIGLRIGKTQIGVRKKLEALARETGGRTFYIKDATELDTVYSDIEDELRSQYLVAYNSDQSTDRGTYREVSIEVRDAKGRKLEARTIRGYYQ